MHCITSTTCGHTHSICCSRKLKQTHCVPHQQTEYSLTLTHLYGPLGALASLITDIHSSLSTALCHHLLTFISHRSFSTSSNHLKLDLPPLLPYSLLSNIFLTILPKLILIKCGGEKGVHCPWIPMHIEGLHTMRCGLVHHGDHLNTAISTPAPRSFWHITCHLGLGRQSSLSQWVLNPLRGNPSTPVITYHMIQQASE
jgi:hypothetical protein